MTTASSSMDLSIRTDGHWLRSIRELCGYSQSQLAGTLRISQQHLSRIEIGSCRVSEAISNGLRRELGVHLGVQPLQAAGRTDRDSMGTVATAESRSAAHPRPEADAQFYRRVVTVLDEQGVLPKAEVLHLRSTKPAFIELHAEILRDHAGLSGQPIPDVVRVIEKYGIAIARSARAGKWACDAALSVTSRPLILLSKYQFSSCHERFAIARELANILMRSEAPSVEKAATEAAEHFAMSFLLPRDSFGQECARLIKGGRLSWKIVAQLKLRWGASKAVILKRSFQLGYLSDMQFSTGLTHLARRGEAIRELDDDSVPREEPRMIPDALQDLHRTQGVAPMAVARMVGVHMPLFAELTGTQVDASRSRNVIDLGTYRVNRDKGRPST